MTTEPGARPDTTPGGDASPAHGEAVASLLRARLRDQGHLWLPVSGTSMGRTIRSGSEVRVLSGSIPRRWEVWAFCTPAGSILVHRVVGRDGPRFLLKGDAMEWLDDPVPTSLLIGKVQRTDRGRGRRRLRRWPGLWLAVRRRARRAARLLPGARPVDAEDARSEPAIGEDPRRER